MPWVLPSKLGLKVVEQWQDIAVEQPLIRSVAFQLMPDHVHGILFATATLPRHIGHYVSRFKARCTAIMRGMSEYSETTSRPPTLWEPGYNDRILAGKGQLRDWADYILDNPRRLWTKRHHREWFTACRGITIGTTPVTIMGNQALLSHPYKVAVQCSRRLNAQEIEAACQRFLSKGRIVIHSGGIKARFLRDRMVYICSIIAAVAGVVAAVASIVALFI